MQVERYRLSLGRRRTPVCTTLTETELVPESATATSPVQVSVTFFPSGSRPPAVSTSSALFTSEARAGSDVHSGGWFTGGGGATSVGRSPQARSRRAAAVV